MAAYTLAQAQAQLDAWLAASLKIAEKQSYEIETPNGRRRLSYADAAEVRAQIEFWTARVNALTASSIAGGGRIRTSYFVPE